jgi:hypothetical protein
MANMVESTFCLNGNTWGVPLAELCRTVDRMFDINNNRATFFKSKWPRTDEWEATHKVTPNPTSSTLDPIPSNPHPRP